MITASSDQTAKRLATGSEDQTARIWRRASAAQERRKAQGLTRQIPSSAVLDAQCQHAGRPREHWHEVLLSVPRYNFNWQSGYRFAQPKHVSAGTRILCTGGFDNSKFNPDNPDPAKSVHGGDQSFEEMFIGFMTVSGAAPRAGTGSQNARVTENARLPQ